MKYNHEDNEGKSLLKIISKNTVPDLQVLHGLHGKKNYFTFNHSRCYNAGRQGLIYIFAAFLISKFVQSNNYFRFEK